MVNVPKFFCAEGPVREGDHYLLPAAERFADDNVKGLIAQKKYFILHAPRQTGKTSSLLALLKELNASGDYACVYINVEGVQGYRENIEPALQGIIVTLSQQVEQYLADQSLAAALMELSREPTSTLLADGLRLLSKGCDKPVVLFIDEIDSLIGDTLVTVLRQVRSGYPNRPEAFPQSVVLCGVRDIKDYRIHASGTARKGGAPDIITGGSCFNIKAKSLRLGNFSDSQVRALYQQHTDETGQAFSEDALRLAWRYTRGQPWLVNALAYEVCFEKHGVLDRSVAIAAADLEAAKERLVLGRRTHLEQLTDRLSEPRVRRVMEPILSGKTMSAALQPDDIEYVRDLGLICRNERGVNVLANGIYMEVVPREMTWMVESDLAASFDRAWYVDDNNHLNMHKLLTAFQEFFREQSESWLERFSYKEAGPQLLLQAFLQRIVNGGGRIDREYGLGRMRTDLFIRWPTTDASYHGHVQQVVLELKILHKSIEATIKAGLSQTAEYMQRVNCEVGHLLVFDRREGVAWEQKVFVREQQSQSGQTICVWGM